MINDPLSKKPIMNDPYTTKERDSDCESDYED